MERKRTVFTKKFLEIILIITVSSFIFSGVTYAFESLTSVLNGTTVPDATVVINKNGHVTCQGNLFGSDLWYPGRQKSGLIRVINYYRNIKVTGLGLKVYLEKVKEGTDSNIAYHSFMDNMKLTLTKGYFFTNVIFENISLKELSYKNNIAGFKLAEDSIEVNKNDSVDLVYTLNMDDQSGNELEGLVASVGLDINLTEKY